MTCAALRGNHHNRFLGLGLGLGLIPDSWVRHMHISLKIAAHSAIVTSRSVEQTPRRLCRIYCQVSLDYYELQL
jgi:hypothetical protein